MRFFFIGGPTDDPRARHQVDWQVVCERLGSLIGETGNGLAVCSSYEKGADRQVFEAYAATGGASDNLLVCHPALPLQVGQEWEDLLAERGLGGAEVIPVDGPDAAQSATRSNAYLLAQLRAIQESDVILAIGGNLGGSATIALSVAIAQNIPILPFSFAGGAAAFAFRGLRQSLLSTLRKHSRLDTLTRPEGVDECINLALALRNPARESRRYVFISHAWARPEETDQVEMELLRLNVPVFRDEREIKPGQAIPEEINRALGECTHFVGIWCAEYACSPHCFDEFHQVTERKENDDSLQVLLLRFDDTRLVWKPMRGEERNWPKISNRAELREALRRFLEAGEPPNV